MKILESSENYLETIYILKRRLGDVRSIDIASELGFSKPSVSIAMKKLRENDYVTTDNSGNITLTEKGLKIAEKMYERHELLSEFLTSIGVSEACASEDACRIEHIISDETFKKVREFMESRRLK